MQFEVQFLELWRLVTLKKVKEYFSQRSKKNFRVPMDHYLRHRGFAPVYCDGNFFKLLLSTPVASDIGYFPEDEIKIDDKKNKARYFLVKKWKSWLVIFHKVFGKVCLKKLSTSKDIELWLDGWRFLSNTIQKPQNFCPKGTEITKTHRVVSHEQKPWRKHLLHLIEKQGLKPKRESSEKTYQKMGVNLHGKRMETIPEKKHEI